MTFIPTFIHSLENALKKFRCIHKSDLFTCYVIYKYFLHKSLSSDFMEPHYQPGTALGVAPFPRTWLPTQEDSEHTHPSQMGGSQAGSGWAQGQAGKACRDRHSRQGEQKVRGP